MDYNNLSNGESDGLAMFYVKDKKIYPVVLTEEQAKMLDMMLPVVLPGSVAIADIPMGEVKDIKDEIFGEGVKQ